MVIWFLLAIVRCILCCALFFYLLSFCRLDVPALSVAIFHMLFAAVVSVAALGLLLDPDCVGYGLGVIHFEKRAVALPAALVLGWALAAVWIAIGKGRGRWMRLVMVGDLFFALSMGVSILLDNSPNWKFQLGEHFTATGVAGLLILLGFFTLPFIASAIWAAIRTQAGGTAPPFPSERHEERRGAEKESNNRNGFRYSGSRV